MTTVLPDSAVTYAGVVETDASSEVRLTIGGDFVAGSVRVDDAWWFVDPLRLYQPGASPDRHVVYRPQGIRFRARCGTTDQAVPEGPAPMAGGSGGDIPTPVINIAMVADQEYHEHFERSGIPFWDGQRALINNVNGIYRRWTNILFRIRRIYLFGPALESPVTSLLMEQFQREWGDLFGDLRSRDLRREMEIEIAHLTTGKRLRDRIWGRAQQPGVYSLSQQLYSEVGGGGGFGGGTFFSGSMIAAHELGHNLNAAHDEADEVCVAHVVVCWDFERTLMWPLLEEDTRREFSIGRRDTAHNNVRRMHANVDSGRRRDL